MLKRAAGLVLSVALALGQPAFGQDAPSVAVLFEKAVQAEKTEGNLDEAAKLYGQVAEQAASDKKIAAEATLRLGKIQLKKGQKEEALKTFKRLKGEFAEFKAFNADATREMARANVALEPVVTKSEPGLFAENVDPGLEKVTVTFSQPMKDKTWSWTGGGEHFPQVLEGIAYDAAMTTCTLPVKLEPGKVYRVGINSPDHRNFRSAEGTPARLYQIIFATKDADGKPTKIPPSMIADVRAWNAAGMKGDPEIVKTNPVAFNDKVPASLSKISVTFNQPMMDQSWSWTGGGDTYPKFTGKPGYDQTRTTCSVPVKLEPGKVYWIGINSPSHQNFQNAAYMPAPWHVIVFATAGADGKPTPIPDDLLKEARRINGEGAPAATGNGEAQAKAK